MAIATEAGYAYTPGTYTLRLLGVHPLEMLTFVCGKTVNKTVIGRIITNNPNLETMRTSPNPNVGEDMQAESHHRHWRGKTEAKNLQNPVTAAPRRGVPS